MTGKIVRKCMVCGVSEYEGRSYAPGFEFPDAEFSHGFISSNCFNVFYSDDPSVKENKAEYSKYPHECPGAVRECMGCGAIEYEGSVHAPGFEIPNDTTPLHDILSRKCLTEYSGVPHITESGLEGIRERCKDREECPEQSDIIG